MNKRFNNIYNYNLKALIMSIIIIGPIIRIKGVIKARANDIKAANTKIKDITIAITNKSIRDYNSKRSATFATSRAIGQ